MAAFYFNQYFLFKITLKLIKKIYLSLVALIAIATSALAQKTANIEVILNAPSANAIINCTESYQISYSFVNHGPDALLASGTLNFKDPESHPDSLWNSVLSADFNKNDTVEI